MSDKTKGVIQLVFVILFIIGSFVLSNLLSALKPEAGKNVGTDRKLYVEAKTILPSDYRIEFDVTGSVETRGVVSVVPEVSGRVINVNDQFFKGGHFQAGDILFQIEPRDFELGVERLEAEVARAKTSLDLEKAEALASLAEWRQLNGNREPPELVSRKPQMAEAEATLKAAKAQLENARLSLQRTSFSMPFAGRVLSSNLELGQYLMAGQAYGEVFANDSLEVKSSLEDRQLDWLLSAENPDITITTTHLGKTRQYRGYLKRSASSLDAQTRFATVSFGFADADKDVELVPGIFADITIQAASLKNVWVFPAESLQKQGFIWLVKEDQTIEQFQPEIIYTDDKHIVSKAKNGGIRVVVNKLPGATEGSTVEIKNEKDRSINEEKAENADS